MRSVNLLWTSYSEEVNFCRDWMKVHFSYLPKFSEYSSTVNSFGPSSIRHNHILHTKGPEVEGRGCGGRERESQRKRRRERVRRFLSLLTPSITRSIHFRMGSRAQYTGPLNTLRHSRRVHYQRSIVLGDPDPDSFAFFLDFS